VWITLFWVSLGLILYTYIGYPLLIAIMAHVKNLKTLKNPYRPTVSVVIAVCNEEQQISKRLENILEQDYPAHLLELVVVSDGSSDRTGEVVCSFKESNLALYHLTEKSCKAAALNYGIARTQGEITVFADARHSFAFDAISQLVANFSDQTVGCVSGKLCFRNEKNSEIKTCMDANWHYEKWIHRNESKSGSAVGATGAVYAIRKRLFKPLPEGTILDDLFIPLSIVASGYRSVFDPSAIVYDAVSPSLARKWQRKARTVAGTWQLVKLAPELFHPFCNPIWWRFMSHKIARLTVPATMVLLFIGGWVADGIYRLTALSELLLFFVATTGVLAHSAPGVSLIKLRCFNITLDSAAVVGFWHRISGKYGGSIWQPAGQPVRAAK
jgi:cellulose synthase/poly-beta-1,6-N-acetylglucosamine synthase-like glycosyltransferase